MDGPPQPTDGHRQSIIRTPPCCVLLRSAPLPGDFQPSLRDRSPRHPKQGATAQKTNCVAFQERSNGQAKRFSVRSGTREEHGSSRWAWTFVNRDSTYTHTTTHVQGMRRAAKGDGWKTALGHREQIALEPCRGRKGLNLLGMGERMEYTPGEGPRVEKWSLSC